MPLPVISMAQMREWEKATWATGRTEAEVIRRVGKAVATQALAMTEPGALILILAGKGHNGEDARCARPHLAGRRTDLLEITDPAADLAKLEALLSLRPGLIIDGLFGIGINRPLSAAWVRLLEQINASGCRVLAVDVPSGLNADSGEPQGAAIQAEITLTVGAPKVGLLRQAAWPLAGRVEVARHVGLAPCAIETEVQWTLAEDFAGYPPRRAVAGHKGSYGHLVILAGSPGYHGAAVLTARGAQRAQPGLITLFTLESVYHPVAGQLQAVMVSPWRQDNNLPGSWSAFLAGPGLAAAEVSEHTRSLVRRWWQESPLPVIVDASALAWLAHGPCPAGAVRVITPHPGEAGRLLGTNASAVQADRLGALRELSRRFGNTWVVLKGHQTLIGGSSGNVFVNPSGNPHLAQGGSGDVLSGYIAGLLAQPALQSDPLLTLRFAVWQHGAAADHLQRSSANWIVEDLILALGGRQISSSSEASDEPDATLAS